MMTASQHFQWIQRLADEAGMTVLVPTLLRSYNQSAISWDTCEKSPSGHSKKIDVLVYFIRVPVKDETLDV